MAKVKELPEFKPMSVEREYFSSLREIFFEDPAIKKVLLYESKYKIKIEIKKRIRFKKSSSWIKF